MWATEGDESSYKVSDPTAVVKTAGGGMSPTAPWAIVTQSPKSWSGHRSHVAPPVTATS